MRIAPPHPACWLRRAQGCLSREFDGSVDSFAVYFFNWRLDKAAQFCTPDSKKWLQFAASQVHPEDLEQMKNLPNNFAYSYEITQGDTKGVAAEVAVERGKLLRSRFDWQARQTERQCHFSFATGKTRRNMEG